MKGYIKGGRGTQSFERLRAITVVLNTRSTLRGAIQSHNPILPTYNPRVPASLCGIITQPMQCRPRLLH